MMQRIDGAGPRSAAVIDPVESASGQLLSELEIRVTYAQMVRRNCQNLPEETDTAADAGQPVFVDATGRRRNLVRLAGLLLGPLLFGYAVVLGISLGTTAEVPMVTWVTPAPQKSVPSQATRKVVKKRRPPISAPLKKRAVKRSLKFSPTAHPKIVSPSPRRVPPVAATPSAVPSPAPVPSATPTHGKPPTAPHGESKNRNST